MKKFFIFWFIISGTFFGLYNAQTCTPMDVKDIWGNDEVLIDCSYPLVNGQCVSLKAAVPDSRQTSSYTVNPISFEPLIPFYAGTPLNANYDDLFAEIIDIPFSFCFFGNNFNQVVIGSNGLLTFDTAQLGKISYPNVEQTNPHPALPRNSIFGVFQDLVFSNTDSSEIYYSIINDDNCRKLVINFFEGRIAGCQDRSSTQIVLSEFTNEIEIFIENKAMPCETARFPNALLGIMNAHGTLGYSPPLRNTGVWMAQQEAWRFSPDGAVITPLIEWFDDKNVRVGTGANINVCPVENETYTAKATYNFYGAPFALTDDIKITFAADFPLARNYTKVFCALPGTSESVNLDDYRQFLTPQNPSNLKFSYHNSLAEANAGSNQISPTQAFNQPRLIYVRIQNPENTGCFRVAQLRFQFISGVTLTNSVTICDTNNDGEEDNYSLATLNAMLFAPDISGTISYYLSETDAENGTNAVRTTTLTDGLKLWLRFTTATCSQVIGPITVDFTPGPTVNSPVKLDITICDINDNNIEPFNFDLTTIPGLVTSEPNVILSYYGSFSDAYAGSAGEISTVREGNYSIYVRVEQPGGCFSVSEVHLEVKFNSVEAKDETKYICFNGSEDITLDLAALSSSMLLSNSAGVTVSFHSAEFNAEENISPLDPAQVITTDGNLVSVRYFVRFARSSECYTIRSITIVLVHPVAAQNTFDVCDFNNDLTETSNLSQFSSRIAGTQPATVSYFQTLEDAQNNSGALTSLMLTSSARLYARIVVHGCVEIYPITLKLVPTPIIAPLVAVSLNSFCDHNNDGVEAYDLTQHQSEVYSGSSPVTFTYYRQYNAENQSLSGMISDPRSFVAAGANTVYARVQFTSSGCFSVSTIQLNITFIPAPVVKEATLRICDEQFNFNETFNLADGIPQMFDAEQNTLNLSDIVISYYRTEAAANAGISSTAVSPLQQPQQSLVTFYARFQAKATNCYSVKPIHLRTYFPPKAINGTVSDICDSNLDGLFEINLLQYTSQMVDVYDPENTFTFYQTLSDAQAGINAIADAENFSVFPLPERIYVKVQNLPGCNDISFITLQAGTTLPLIQTGPFTLYQCDAGNDGQEVINLTAFEEQMYPGAKFEYYPSLNDLNKSTNVITAPSSFSFNKNSNPSSVYAKVSFAGFCPTYAIINVNLKKTPQFTISDHYFCPYNNGSVDIEPDFSGQDIISYEWRNPAGEIVSTSAFLRDVNVVGTYSIFVTASNGCTFTTNFDVKHLEVPVITQLVANGSNYTVIATGSRAILYSTDGLTWQSGNIFYNLPVGQTTFYVKFSGEECIGLPKKGVILDIPNAFTPNGDGINDVWQISGLDVFEGANSSIQIFDRQQVLVHQEEGPNRLSWDGKWMGRPLSTGTYWYVLKLPDGRVFYGWIFLKNRD